jgi:hypothetical protein
MSTDHMPAATRNGEPAAQHLRFDATDRELAPLARDWFEHDLRERIDAAMDRQLVIFLAGEESRRGLARAS